MNKINEIEKNAVRDSTSQFGKIWVGKLVARPMIKMKQVIFEITKGNIITP